jgi:integrase
MGRVFRPSYRDRHGASKQTTNWYVEFTDTSGKTTRRKVGRDKRLAEQVLAREVARVERERNGYPTESTSARTRKLADWIGDYLGVLAARGLSGGYVRGVTDHLDTLVPGCGWQLWPDVTTDSVTMYLGRRREEFGNGPATLNAYMRTAKGFARWVADRLGEPSPLRGLKPFNEQVDQRRSRRILTDAELVALIAAADRCPKKHNAQVSGPDRAMLYRVAAYTGLRASELASLTPQQFDLDSSPPTVTVDPKFAKSRRNEPVPIPAHLVALLRPWLAGRPRDARVWPGTWARDRRQQMWVARDVKRAGIAETDERGRGITFHGLKRKYVSLLIRSGAEVDDVKRMARHKDARTTINYYTDRSLRQLGDIADRLPPPV